MARLTNPNNWAHDLNMDDPIYRKLAAYEDLEEQGRLVVLPCKVGKHLYAATRNIISEFEVKGFELDGSGMVWVTWEVVSGMYGHFRIDGIPDDAIGKTVFLTRAEAEAALKGVSDDA